MEYTELSAGDVGAEKTFENVRVEEMKTVSALLRDPNPIHFDSRHVQEEGLPGFINQGPINMSYVTQALLEVTKSPADLQSLSIRLEENVFDGETVTARALVQSKRDDERLVKFDVELETPDGSTAVTGEATVHFPRR